MIRAHHLAAGAKGELKVSDLAVQKGGFTSKTYLITNAHGLPVRAEVTGGEISGFNRFDALVDKDLPTARVFLPDRGYDSYHIRSTIAEREGAPVIPAKGKRW